MLGFNKKNNQKKEAFIFEPAKYEQKDINSREIANDSYPINTEENFIIESYFQTNINLGIMLGLPSDLSPYFEHCFSTAKEFFKSKEFFTIDPVIFFDKEDNDASQDNDSSQRTAYLLPRFLTMATITRHEPLFAEGKTFASINLIWWQSSLGVPENHILEKIKNISWLGPYGWSWDF